MLDLILYCAACGFSAMTGAAITWCYCHKRKADRPLPRRTITIDRALILAYLERNDLIAVPKGADFRHVKKARN